MTAKRYFKRMWEDEFYIFDSETISEKEFDEKVEYEDYQAFADSMLGDEVVELLNEQHETIERLKQNIDELLSVNVEEELLKENEQLKQAYHSLLHDVCIDAECDRDSYRKDIASLEKENEQLKYSLSAYMVDLNNYKGRCSALEQENEQLKKELFESKKDYILETYADNPIRRNGKLKELEKELEE